MITAQKYHSHGHGSAIDRLSLSYEDRFLRRKVLTLASGESILIDLEQTTSLDHGGVLITTSGEEVAIEAKEEPLMQIKGAHLLQLAWHIGNRHTPCQIENDRLLIQRDHVLKDMLEKLGADILDVTEPFTPEGGAYGHGRTHGHQH